MAGTEHERFVELIEAHQKILYKVAHAYCRNPEEHSDLIQEIIVQLWRSFERFDERYRFSTWMYRIAMNVAISYYRSESRRTRHSVQLGEAILEIAAPEPESDDIRMLRQFIDGLDPLNKALIILYLDGNNYDAIAEIIGISTTNVATKISRIKQRLRRDFDAASQGAESTSKEETHGS
ncbi:MAG: sigma-70 family RNA polymerase sigma factor [Chloroflexales bacterium]|nr:sigma-70 family RNA polymerase sigma factor [Chloroflexales bacterium]